MEHVLVMCYIFMEKYFTNNNQPTHLESEGYVNAAWDSYSMLSE